MIKQEFCQKRNLVGYFLNSRVDGVLWVVCLGCFSDLGFGQRV